MFTKQELTRQEKFKLNEWLTADLRGREFEWLQFRDGTIDDETYESDKAAIAINLGTTRTRRWWKVNRTYYDPGFADMVDSYLDASPLTEFFAGIEKWN